MVSKKLHFIWLGKNNMPVDFPMFLSKWIELYKEYEIILWTDDMVEEENIISKELKEYYYENLLSVSFKSDILRYLILYKYGGLYFDTDFEPIRKIPDSFLTFDFLGGIQNNGEVNIAFIGSSKENELIKNVIDYIPKQIRHAKNNNYYVSDQIHRITGPVFFDEIVKNYKNRENYFFFTKEYLYPYWFLEKNRRNENFKTTSPLCYAVHHWNMSWNKF